jgi:hypothetical protein
MPTQPDVFAGIPKPYLVIAAVVVVAIIFAVNQKIGGILALLLAIVVLSAGIRAGTLKPGGSQ